MVDFLQRNGSAAHVIAKNRDTLDDDEFGLRLEDLTEEFLPVVRAGAGNKKRQGVNKGKWLSYVCASVRVLQLARERCMCRQIFSLSATAGPEHL